MRDLVFKKPLYFYLLFIPFIIVGGVILLQTSKSDLFLYFNAYHSPFADQFFFWLTWLGNGLIFSIVCLFILLRNWGDGLLGFACFIVSAIIPQFLKKVIFTDSIRPVKFFDGIHSLHLVGGVNQHHHHSFPSGHSASIFALSLLLTLIVKDKRWGVLFGLIAILTAFSRVYLAQHFFEDIYAGACIGFLSTMLVFIAMNKWIKTKTNLNKGLLKF